VRTGDDTSDDDALRRLGLLVLEEGEARCVLEDLPNALACPCRAFEVLLRADLLRYDYTLFWGNGPLRDLAELLLGPRVIAQVLLAADEQHWEVRAEVRHLGMPLLLYVVERIRGVYGEADEDDMGVGVGQRAEAIVILLTSGIPQREFDGLAVDLYVRNVVLKDRWHVHLWERALTEDDEKTGLSACAITDDDELPADNVLSTANVAHDG